jgi:hypothetical protein
MAQDLSFNVGNFALELDGQFAGHLASAEIGSIKADAIDMPVGSDTITKKMIGNPEYGDFTVTVGMSQAQAQIDWIASIWNKKVMERSGAVILADQNFKERRRAVFRAAQVVDVKFDDLDASGKKPYQCTYKFAPEHVEYVSGTGAVVKGELGNKQKAWTQSNFRIKMGGLPCDHVTKVSGLHISSEIAKEYHGQFRFPTRHTANIKYDDLKLTISGNEKQFTEWNKFTKMTLWDGVAEEKEELTCVIEWLSPDLKRTLGTATLTGCGLKEFKFSSDKFEHNKAGMAAFEATFMIEEMRFTIDHK